jgi:ABC-type multidrug transport system fused ATPase/permease subunit
LRNPDVVILDEASSRLDPYTEHLVHAAMSRLLDGRTGVIVAHRLSTVSLASDILVLEDGRVWEIGSRSDLAADPSSRFAQMLRVAIAGTPR